MLQHGSESIQLKDFLNYIRLNKRTIKAYITLDKQIYLECFPRHLKMFIPERTLNIHVIFSHPFLSKYKVKIVWDSNSLYSK